jgi:predicted nicotinamide N-methyase
VAALALGLLPAVVGLGIVLGWTVPLEFGAGVGLAIVACFKAGAGAWGMVAASRAQRPAVRASAIHL